jgi:hypothetical protein
MDSEYFLHIAQLNAALLRDTKDHRAALAIRLAYSHGLETLMAFAGATVQAPACPLGWVLRYKNDDLRKVIEKLMSGTVAFAAVTPATWDGLATLVVAAFDLPEAERASVAQCYAKLWKRFAFDFLDLDQLEEYNSLKHGFRVRPGGFAVRIGEEVEEGVASEPSKRAWLGGSEYGTSYFKSEYPFKGKKGGKIDFRPRSFSRNWHPEGLISGLELLASSLHNIISLLRVLGRDPTPVTFWPTDPNEFASPWRYSMGVTSASHDLPLDGLDIRQSTSEEVLRQLTKPTKASDQL